MIVIIHTMEMEIVSNTKGNQGPFRQRYLLGPLTVRNPQDPLVENKQNDSECQTCLHGYNKLGINFDIPHITMAMLLGYRWLCEEGWECDLQHIIQHIHDGTLSKYHENFMNLYFPLVVASTIENINMWIEMYGVPSFKFSLPVSIPKENLIYILDNGYDPNNFCVRHFLLPIERYYKNQEYMVTGMCPNEIIKLFVHYGYRLTPISYGDTYNENIFYYVNDLQLFHELLEMTTFTIEDAKRFITSRIFTVVSTGSDEPSEQIILYLIKKYNLREYVENLPEMQRVIKFKKKIKQSVESLDTY